MRRKMVSLFYRNGCTSSHILFVKRAILLLLPKDCPGDSAYPPPKSLFIFSESLPHLLPRQAFLFSARFINVDLLERHHADRGHGVGAGAFGNGISEALFYRVLRHWL